MNKPLTASGVGKRWKVVLKSLNGEIPLIPAIINNRRIIGIESVQLGSKDIVSISPDDF
jgi:hypothetical protein